MCSKPTPVVIVGFDVVDGDEGTGARVGFTVTSVFYGSRPRPVSGPSPPRPTLVQLRVPSSTALRRVLTLTRPGVTLEPVVTVTWTQTHR